MSDPREPSENTPAENDEAASSTADQGGPSATSAGGTLPPFPSANSEPKKPEALATPDAAPSAPDEPSAPEAPATPDAPSAPPASPSVPPIAPPVPPRAPSAPSYGAPSTPSAPNTPSAPSYGAPPVYGSAPTASGTPAVPTPPAYAAASAPSSPYGPPSSGGGYPNAYAPVPPKKGNGLAITSIVLGGVSLLACAIPFLNYLTLFVGLAGLIIGLIALLRKLGSRALSLTGTILSGVAFLLTIALASFYTIQFVNAANTISDYTSTSAPYLPDDSSSDSPDNDALPGDPTAVPGDPTPSAGAVVCTDGTSIAKGKAGILTYDGQNQAEVSIDAVELDATDTVMERNSLNTEPPAGYQYAILSVTVKQLGTESFQAGGISAIFKGVAEDIATEANYAVLPEPELIFAPDLTPGDSVTGNIAVFVPTSGADSGAVLLSHYSTDNTCELSLK